MRKIFLITVLCLFLIAFSGVALGKEWPAKTNVPVDYVWTIEFNRPVDINTINDYSIYIANNLDQKENCQISLSPDKMQIRVYNSSEYCNYVNYLLHISNSVQSIDEVTLEESINMKFTTVPANDAIFLLGTVQSKQPATSLGDIKGYIDIELENEQEQEYFVSCFTTIDGDYNNNLFQEILPGQIIYFSVNNSEPKHIQTILTNIP